LVVKLNGSTLTITTDYTVNTGTDVITLIPTLTVGDVVYIDRVTDIDEALVTYTNNALIEADDLNTSHGQLLHRLQEIENDTANTIRLDVSVNPTCWDAQSKRICNLANGTASTDAVNLGQVTALISGADPMDVSDASFATANGDGSETEFVPQTDGGDYFPTTDVSDSKIIVAIDGILQKPGVDYEYVLNTASRPQVNFLTGAPPAGTGNIQFRTFQGVVTTTYDAATLDGSVIIDGTLDGDALIDDSVDGGVLEDGTVELDKLTAGSGAADRFAVFNASGVPTARVLTASDIPTADITNSELTEVVTSATAIHTTPYTYTNNTGGRVFLCASLTTFQGGGNVQMTPDGGSAVTMGTWNNSGGSLDNLSFSFFVPADAEVTFTGSGSSDSLRRLTVQEV
jgi:hypothetical protein